MVATISFNVMDIIYPLISLLIFWSHWTWLVNPRSEWRFGLEKHLIMGIKSPWMATATPQPIVTKHHNHRLVSQEREFLITNSILPWINSSNVASQLHAGFSSEERGSHRNLSPTDLLARLDRFEYAAIRPVHPPMTPPLILGAIKKTNKTSFCRARDMMYGKPVAILNRYQSLVEVGSGIMREYAWKWSHQGRRWWIFCSQDRVCAQRS